MCPTVSTCTSSTPRATVARCARRSALCRRGPPPRGRARRSPRAPARRRAGPSPFGADHRPWTRHRGGDRRTDHAARVPRTCRTGIVAGGARSVLADGPAVGIATVAVVDAARGGGTTPARFAQRWVFHLADPGDAPPLGVPAARVPPAIPGRLVVAASGLEAQVAMLGRDPLAGGGGPAAVDVLPRLVPANGLGRTGRVARARRRAADGCRLRHVVDGGVAGAGR